MDELYNEIFESEINSQNLINPKWKNKTEISFRQYRIEFNGTDEPNYGRLVLKFKLFKNDSDITNEISKLGYCYPKLFPFYDTKSNYIYIPTENKLVLINTITDEVFKFDYPEPMGFRHNFFYDNYLVLVFRKSYLIIDLNHLKIEIFKENDIDFVYPINNKFIVFKNWFQKFEIKSFESFSIIDSADINIDSRKLYVSTIEEYERKRHESQKGYLWTIGHKEINNSKYVFLVHKWNLVGYNFDELTLDLGTTIPLSEGIMDDKRRMWFDVENKYIRINIKALVANTCERAKGAHGEL